VDADGDEIMSGGGRDELVSGDDAGLVLSEETLEQIELRKGEIHIVNTQRSRSDHSSLRARS
jgi:hypothetical protein